MKPIYNAAKHAAKIIACLLFCIGLITNVAAQKKAKASSRVFYGQASFYSNKFNGRKTASGEIFSQNKLTCACNVLPLGTYIKVINVHNGKWAIVKVNDRLHIKTKRLVDLTRATAIKLGYMAKGLARVKVEVIGKNKPA